MYFVTARRASEKRNIVKHYSRSKITRWHLLFFTIIYTTMEYYRTRHQRVAHAREQGRARLQTRRDDHKTRGKTANLCPYGVWDDGVGTSHYSKTRLSVTRRHRRRQVRITLTFKIYGVVIFTTGKILFPSQHDRYYYCHYVYYTGYKV